MGNVHVLFMIHSQCDMTHIYCSTQ